MFNILAVALLFVQASEPNTTRSECFNGTLCEAKNKVRWRTPAWDEKMCERVGNAIQDSAAKHGLSPQFLLAFIFNESEANERAYRVSSSEKNGVTRYFIDAGLMGIRCELGDERKCKNKFVKGLTVKELMDPVKNIEVGAAILAYIKDRSGVEGVCDHKGHPWWSHYNWGPRAFSKGSAAHYGQRIAVLAHAMGKATNVEVPELNGVALHKEKGAKPRRVDKPVGKRQERLYTHIVTSEHCRQYAYRP